MKIELLKTESEWALNSLGCYISVDNKLFDVVTPLNNPHEVNSIEIPIQGVLRLIIRDMGKTDGYLASVSVPISILATASPMITLPLFDSPASDQVNHLIIECPLPRISLALSNDCSDDEIFLSSQEANLDHPSDFVIASRISLSNEPEELLLQTSNFKTIQETTIESQKQDIVDILNTEIDDYKQEISKEKDKNSILQTKILQLMGALKTNSEKAFARESSLLDLVNEKEEKINKCIEINIELQAGQRKIEFEKQQMREKYEKYEAQEKYVESLEKELKKYQDMLRVAEKSRDELANTLAECSRFDTFDEQNMTRRQMRMPYEYAHLENFSVPSSDALYGKCLKLEKVFEEKDISEEKMKCSSDDIKLQTKQSYDMNDSLVKKIIQKTIGKIIPLSMIERIRECLYKVNGVEISIAICDDGIYVKNGKSLQTLQEFWTHERGPSTKSPISKSKSPLWDEKNIENNSRRQLPKTSPTRNFLKSTESSTFKTRSPLTKFGAKNFINILPKKSPK
ncbi:hypothetical protein SteCoe_20090 [Stentor coeruleus]|uniref:Uncharacterized protein n=1 Tax=Stentor coeruleus TaxID=5963 RepID=A0A1R2BSQ8_9CILI|nr:hypothetical protein SteCoe_20090 [Stentor coeruleus]